MFRHCCGDLNNATAYYRFLYIRDKIRKKLKISLLKIPPEETVFSLPQPCSFPIGPVTGSIINHQNGNFPHTHFLGSYRVANTTQSVRETAVGKTEKAPELRCSLHLNSVLKSALDENVQQECICHLFIAKVIHFRS